MRRVEKLSPELAVNLIRAPGVSIGEVSDSIGSFDGDLLMRFHLPNGEAVEYVARHESDYYGGGYTEVEWWLCNNNPEYPAELIQASRTTLYF